MTSNPKISFFFSPPPLLPVCANPQPSKNNQYAPETPTRPTVPEVSDPSDTTPEVTSYTQVSATAPPALDDVDAGSTTSSAPAAEGGTDIITSMLFGAGKEGETSSSVATDEGATGAGSSPEKEGGVMNFFEKVAVAVGLVSSDDDDEEETTATKTATATAAP